MDTQKVNGNEGQSEEWNQIDWRKTKKIVRNLRQRIYRARELGQFKRMRNLQKLLLKSRANLLLSVRQITQVNTGKQTAGIDKEVVNTPAQRVKLVREWEKPKACPTKRVYIPKTNGKKRPLGIPTIRDRVAQAVVKNVLEPEWEAKFEPNSYGFRPGRSCTDAIEQCFNRLNGKEGNDTWVLDADIKGFFDNLAHESIQDKVGNNPCRELINGWLKAGYIDKGIYNNTKQGTPQGGVISPLLANIGLDGLEKFVQKLPYKIGIVRYADDFIITGKSQGDLEEVQTRVKQWLKIRGLELSEEKTRIVHILQGFDFLGFNIRQYSGKLLIKPQKEKVLAFCKKIGKVIKEMAQATQEQIIRKLNPLLRGFANYYRGVVSKETFSYISHRVWKYLWCWAQRRHPNKGIKWVKTKYFQRIKGRDWTFACKTKGRKGEDKILTLYAIESTKIIRHVKVKGNASPDNPNLKGYWHNRRSKNGSKRWAKNSKYEQVAKNQNWQCPICGEHLFNGEEIETHHIIPVAEGGSDLASNLVHMHKACHKQHHSKSKFKRLEVRLEPDDG